MNTTMPTTAANVAPRDHPNPMASALMEETQIQRGANRVAPVARHNARGSVAARKQAVYPRLPIVELGKSTSKKLCR